ncbi:MAG TPA: PucR family transcriptional regulator ligand-binding domain-containing protein [Candidatus Eremiobacteraceae bacterium]|nr:PucR family transcriptional regulator ligand-binding domain-containing protein [Candidatus Eremiobacteraceae bacterium]
MNVREALQMSSMASARVVAGEAGLDRDVRWAHVIDMPEPAPWVRPGQLLLTTGFAWPPTEAAQRKQIRMLTDRGLAAMALAVPRYLEHFTDAAREEADRRGLPLLEIPFDVPFAQITEELHRAIIAEQYSLLERSEEIHRALTRGAASGSNLNDLARSLGELINRSVTFEDPAGKLLAFYEHGSEDDLVRRETLERAQSPEIMQETMERTGLLAEVRANTGPVRVPAVPDIGLNARVVCPIRLGDELVGLVWIIEGDRKLSELDNRAAEHAALVAALHVAHQRELASMESRLGYASFLSLLETEEDDAQAVERARLLGFDPGGLHRIAIAVIPEPLPLTREGFHRRERAANAIRHRLQSARHRPLLTTSLNYVAFLLPDGVDVNAIWRALGDESIVIVLGRSYTGAQGARRSYREAQSLLTYRDNSNVRRFEDALVPRVLMGDAAARTAFIDDLLGPLETHKNGEMLKRVLLTYARSGFNFKKTAETLAIHPNTLRYRLNRAVEILKIQLDDSEIRFRFQLATRILDFLHNN